MGGVTRPHHLGVELRSRALQAIPAKGAIIPLGLRHGLQLGVIAQPLSCCRALVCAGTRGSHPPP